MISDEEWRALPEEEKERRRKLFKMEIQRVLARYDKEVCKAALKAVIKEVEL